MNSTSETKQPGTPATRAWLRDPRRRKLFAMLRSVFLFLLAAGFLAYFIQHADERSRTRQQCERHMTEATTAFDSQEYAEAEAEYREALSLAQDLHDKRLGAVAKSRVGRCLYEIASLQELPATAKTAITYLRPALASSRLDRKSGDLEFTTLALADALRIAYSTSPDTAMIDEAEMLLGQLVATAGESTPTPRDLRSRSLVIRGNLALVDTHEGPPPSRAREAVKHYIDAQQQLGPDTLSVLAASIENNLGLAYLKLAEEGTDKSTWALRSVNVLLHSLTKLRADREPASFATAALNLGNAYRVLSETSERTKNLVEARTWILSSMGVFTKARYPICHARAQVSFGNIERDTWETDQDVQRLRNAAGAVTEGLAALVDQALLVESAQARNSLGNVHRDWANHKDQAAHLESAMDNYRLAVTVFESVDMPDALRTTRMNLGIVTFLLGSARGDRSIMRDGTRIEEEVWRQTPPSNDQFCGLEMNLGFMYMLLSQTTHAEDDRRVALQFLGLARDCFSSVGNMELERRCGDAVRTLRQK